MNEEEAIEELKKICIEVLKNDNLYNYDNYSPFEKMSMVETVLNLLEKYKKDYISISKRANEYKKAIECEKCNCSVCQAHLNNIELQSELEKKDKESHFIQSELDIANAKIIKLNKIIDLMAEYINDIDVTEVLCKISVCEEQNDCKECIKQHFENETNRIE